MLIANCINMMIHPLIIGFLIAVMQPRINERIVVVVVTMWTFVSFWSLSFFFIYNAFYNKISVIKFFDVINFLDFNIPFDIAVDSVTFLMLFVVSFISYCVMIFACWYMKGDPNFLKFIAFLSFFSFFMLILVAANNVIIMFVGWEGIGLFSYLLINFWNTRLNANRSALKAIVFNKVGDCFFYFFIIVYSFVFESITVFDVKQIFNVYAYYDGILLDTKIIHFLALCLIFAGMAKSAQVILHVWLPDAMEGPTPVSALLHAATMVTAGIYLLVKFNWLVFCDDSLCCFLVFVGILTNLVASLTAIFQHDIKKIIAYSTASQLGLIFIAFGSLKFNLAIFHIFNHAFFKALLFILAGIVIHFLLNKQDLRSIFKLNHKVIFIYIGFILSSLTLIGFPYFSAFYSKDYIINYSFINILITKDLVLIFLMFSMTTTFLYAFKLIFFLFYNEYIKTFCDNFKSRYLTNLKIFLSEEKIIHVCLVVYALLFFSIFVGYITSSYFQFDFLTATWTLASEINLEKKNSFNYLELSFSIIIFIVIYSIPVLVYNLIIIKYNFIFSKFQNFFYFFNKKTLFDSLYYVLTKVFLLQSNNNIVILDKILIEYLINVFIKTKNKIIAYFKNLYANLKWWWYVIVLILILVDIFLCIVLPANVLFIAFNILISYWSILINMDEIIKRINDWFK